ncbi:MAG: hypothetical protein MZU91_10960 [Desulfosudis oleivorans]|nr:hypothetical protein [Desulfosudis oleivorans]
MKRNGRTLAAVFLVGALIAGVLPVAAQEAGAFKVGAAPPPQEVYTKVNLTEPYDIIEGFTIYPSLTSPDLFYYVPKPRVARTEQGRLVFRLLSYAMAENKNQVGSADVAGGYLQLDVTMSPNPDEEKAIKQQLLNPPKRFAATRLQTGKFLVGRLGDGPSLRPDVRPRRQAEEHPAGPHPHPQPQGQGQDPWRDGRR